MKKSTFRIVFSVVVLFALLFSITAVQAAEEDTSVISTIAGVGLYYGDNGPAEQAIFSYIYDIDCDDTGNTYIVDKFNHRIRKIDPSGIISNFAGNGSFVESGIGGPAELANFNGVQAVTTGLNGEVYIATGSSIFVVDTNGIVNLYAGGGGIPVIVSGPAVGADISRIMDMAIDQMGNLYIACQFNNKIIKIDTNGTAWVIAGTGEAGYNGDNIPALSAQINNPNGIAINSLGEILFADSSNSRVRKIDNAGIITTFAGTGNINDPIVDGVPAVTSGINEVFKIAVDEADNLYLSANSTQIRKIDSFGIISAVIGDGHYLFDGHNGLAVNGLGELIYALNDEIVNLINSVGQIEHYAGAGSFAGDGGPAAEAVLNMPYSIIKDNDGNIVIGDIRNYRIRNIDQNGIISTIAGIGDTGTATEGMPAVESNVGFVIDLTVDSSGNIFFCHPATNNIYKIDNNGILVKIAGNGIRETSGDGGLAVDAGLNYPYALEFDTQGNLYVSEYEGYRIRKIDTDGIITTIAGTGTIGYSGDDGPAAVGEIGYCTDIKFDSAGNLYFTDTRAYAVRMIDVNGIITTVAGNGVRLNSGDGGLATEASLFSPWGIAFDSQDNMYISDYITSRIRKVDTSGIITTIAGSGGWGGFGGDGGPATLAELDGPRGMYVDADDNLYIADSENHRIRFIEFTEKHDIIYDGNENTSGEMPETVAAAVDSLTTVSSNTDNLAKDKYVFSGWNTEPDGSGITYMPGSQILMSEEDIVLFARWIPEFFSYEIIDDEIKILEYTGSDNHVDIPDIIEGYPVTSIYIGVFQNMEFITSVSIPDTVNYIGPHAFSGTNLASVQLPDNLEIVAGDAFADNQLTELILPESVIIVTYGAFRGNQLSSISLPDSLREIGHFTFLDNNLTYVELPPNLEIIGLDAFKGNSIQSITIPDSVYKIERNAFAGMDYQNITLGTGVTNYWLFTEGFLQGHIAAPAELVIPAEINGILVKRISNEAFYSADNITSAVIPDGIWEIGHHAFRDNKLTEIIIPESVKKIGDMAFSGNNISSILIPRWVEQLGKNVFDGNAQTPAEFTIIGLPASVSQTYAVDNGHSFTAFPLVAFFDWDMTSIKSEYVTPGKDATAPAEPERYGFLFTGWSTDFTGVTEDISVIAEYVSKPLVSFYDWDMALLKSEYVIPEEDALRPLTRKGMDIPSSDGTETLNMLLKIFL